MKNIILTILLLTSSNLFSQVWKPLSPLLYGYGEPARIYTLTIYNNKLLISGGILYVGSYELPQPNIGVWTKPLTWDGSVYDSIPGLCNFYGIINSFTVFNNKLYCGGQFANSVTNTGVGNIPNTKFIARYNGTNMEALGTSAPSSYVIIMKANNYLYIGGAFYYIGNTSFRAIAKHNGYGYSTVGGGMYGMNPHVQSMAEYNNEIIVGGSFSGTQDMVSPNIAAWNGTSWHKLKDEYLVSPYNMVVDTINNFLYVASQEYLTDSSSGIERWDGYNWEDLFIPGSQSFPRDLCMYHNELYAALFYHTADTILLRFDGATWFNVPGLDAGIGDMCVYNDDLYLAGGFTIAGTDSVNGIVALHVDPPTGCDWLIPRAFVLDDTLTLWNGIAGAQLYNNNAYADSWYWDFGDSSFSTEKDPQHDYTDTGIFNVSVTVTHGSCVKTATNTVVVEINTGMDNFKVWDYGFKIYPNPTSGEITVECNMPQNVKGEIKTFNSYGSIRGTFPLQTGQNKFQIKPDEITTGISLCGLYIEGKQVLIEKVVKHNND